MAWHDFENVTDYMYLQQKSIRGWNVFFFQSAHHPNGNTDTSLLEFLVVPGSCFVLTIEELGAGFFCSMKRRDGYADIDNVMCADNHRVFIYHAPELYKKLSDELSMTVRSVIEMVKDELKILQLQTV